MIRPARPLALALVVLGSFTLVGCTEAMLPRGETMAIQDGRYHVYAPPGSTGTIESPGFRSGGMAAVPNSTDVYADGVTR